MHCHAEALQESGYCRGYILARTDLRTRLLPLFADASQRQRHKVAALDAYQCPVTRSPTHVLVLTKLKLYDITFVQNGGVSLVSGIINSKDKLFLDIELQRCVFGVFCVKTFLNILA